jgi:tetratricopeptide (TPR) repeat protein
MRSAAAPVEDEHRIPQLAPDWDPAGCVLTPAEGFLLSRIDGRTPWAQLRQIGGIPPEEVDRCLERWLSEGILTVNGADPSFAGGARSPAGAPGSETSGTADGGAEAQDGYESGIDLSREQQRRILEFEASLDRSYHALLGVDRHADSKAIKRAYFALSKEFHPDRYFRREIGGFALRLDRIFRKIVEAYELLSDPATRAEIERSMSQQAPPAAATVAPDTERRWKSPPAAPAAPISGKRAALERLRQHFRVPEKVLVERRFKAKQFYQAAMISAKKGRWLEAGASVRLAIAFDPWNDEYKSGFAEVQAQVHHVRANELLHDADASLDANAQQQAMRMYEEALGYRPCDPEINEKAARLALELGDLDAAREYAETACEANPQATSPYLVLGKILARQGLFDKAKERLQQALELDPDAEETKSEIDRLNRNRRRHR